MSGLYWKPSLISREMKGKREKEAQTFLSAGDPAYPVDVTVNSSGAEEYVRFKPVAVGDTRGIRAPRISFYNIEAEAEDELDK